MEYENFQIHVRSMQGLCKIQSDDILRTLFVEETRTTMLFKVFFKCVELLLVGAKHWKIRWNWNVIQFFTLKKSFSWQSQKQVKYRENVNFIYHIGKCNTIIWIEKNIIKWSDSEMKCKTNAQSFSSFKMYSSFLFFFFRLKKKRCSSYAVNSIQVDIIECSFQLHFTIRRNKEIKHLVGVRDACSYRYNFFFISISINWYKLLLPWQQKGEK